MKNHLIVLSCTLFLLVGRVTGEEISDLQRATDGRNNVSLVKGYNHLQGEKSPYLQQHAANPVHWYPWGEEALERARMEDKPIFLSIGYSTCHWCHVMAHESFEDPEIAAFLNRYFISIKVDREERPDIDQLYMNAAQAMTGSGGWPLSLFLFPDTKPFYAGTYFPPRAAYGRPGFLQLLQILEKAWREDRKDLQRVAEQVTSHLRQGEKAGAGSLEEAWLSRGFDEVTENYDPKYGGFGQAPKFPRPVVIDFLLRHYRAEDRKEARDMALFTLEQMAAGGMYDHLGGGFHRYSVDARFHVPHFEKMLYDQGQLAAVYLSAFQISGDPFLRETAEQILDYVLGTMRDPAGGFYSAEDADSEDPYHPGEHGEGAYYLWTAKEIDSLLTLEEASLFKSCYGVKSDGNVLHDPQQEFSGRNILHRTKDLAELSRLEGLSEEEVAARLERGREKLLQRRERRVRPHLDNKVITAWNGLMMSALARGGMILANERYLDAAEETADFLMDNLFREASLKRRWHSGEAKYPATLEDYSFVIQGLLDLYTARQSPLRLRQAMELTDLQISLFADEEGGFYDTPSSSRLLARMKSAYDGAEPSGNSVAAINLLRLATLTGREEYRKRGEMTIRAFSKTLAAHPSAMPLMLAALGIQKTKQQQIVIAGERDGEDTRALLREVHSRYLPDTILILADNGENQKFLKKHLPFLATVEKVKGRATAYVCEDFTCKMPVNRVEDLARLLDGRTI